MAAVVAVAAVMIAVGMVAAGGCWQSGRRIWPEWPEISGSKGFRLRPARNNSGNDFFG